MGQFVPLWGQIDAPRRTTAAANSPMGERDGRIFRKRTAIEFSSARVMKPIGSMYSDD
jgi:hypothetical protein